MKLKNTLHVAALAAALALASGCSVEKPATVVEKSDTPANITSASAGEPNPASEAASDEPDVPETAALGDTVSVASWDVKVTHVQLDATAAIKKVNQFNEAAAGRYVLVSYEATYTGPERIGDTLADLSWSFTTTDSQVNDQSYVVTPMDDSPTEARQGGTVKRDVVFDLAPELVTGGILTVEAYDDAFDLVYADFAV